jgi:hypothetical protein
VVNAFRDVMRRNGLKEIPLTPDPDGSKIIFAG